MSQRSFSDLEYSAKRKQTRRDRFLGEIDAITPWAALVEAIEPHYPKGKRGRPPIGLERMLRMYVAQQCFNLSDEGIEDAVYDSQAIRRFVGIDLSREDAPDATTLLQFRRLLEQHNLTQVIFDRINVHLQQRGLLLREGTVVDATLIKAPPSTKNREKARDPEMHQAKKGNQWYFGMKAHIGADVVTGLVHTVKGTAANVSDVSQVPELLHGEEASLHGDAGYIGAEKRLNGHRPETHIARKRGTVRALPEGAERDQVRTDERHKAQLRSTVEHPFHVVKNLFGYRKVRYRGLKKNTAQLHSLFALANLYRARRWGLLPQG
ncbi:IS5 family transposase [Thioalkalivibrio sp. ALE20]|uniref:IS5 family transposase n=1 Tax=Thioalkalivibrio sp. ALE20 TaxID=545275 RepID=UPI00036C298B|nr:IS5 family transposase [Thioalkalivibrio sp. ALE20]